MISKGQLFVKQFRQFQDNVLWFNKVAGTESNLDTVILYFKLLREEAKEMEEAESDIERLDSLVDQCVVAEQLSRMLGAEDGLLSESSFGAMITRDSELALPGSVSNMEMDSLRVVNMCDIILEDPDNFSYDSMLDALLNVMSYIVPDLYDCGCDVGMAMTEIMNSNMSKFIPANTINDEDILDNICKTIEQEGRYEGITWGLYSGYYVFREKGGKIVKPTGYFKEPDLSKCF